MYQRQVRIRCISTMPSSRITVEYQIPPELKMDVVKYVAAQEPITILDVRTTDGRLFDVGWMKMAQVDRTWREITVQTPTVWADSVCDLAHRDAMRYFVQTASKVALTLDLDRLLQGCYARRTLDSLHWLVDRHATELKRAKYIKSTLLSGSTIWTHLNCLTTSLGPHGWPNLFSFEVYDRLRDLTCHTTPGMEFPRIIDPNIQNLELVPCETVSVNEESEAGIITKFTHRPCWVTAPVTDSEPALQWISTFTRARSITLNGFCLRDRPNPERREFVNLPSLTRLNLRGPHITHMFDFAASIRPDPFRRLHVATTLGERFNPPPEAIEHSGLTDLTSVDMIVEGTASMRWTTICTPGTRAHVKPAFCDGQTVECLSAEENSKATFYWRAGAMSRKCAVIFVAPYDPFLGIASDNITHLTIRELSRPHKSGRTWQRTAIDYDFVTSLTNLETLKIEDERAVYALGLSINSRKLKTIELVCRHEWHGPSGMLDLIALVSDAARKSETRITVKLTGVRRWWDQEQASHARRSRTYDLVDERVKDEEIETDRAHEDIMKDLQDARRKLAEAEVSNEQKPNIIGEF